jgi:hypothetical protein
MALENLAPCAPDCQGAPFALITPFNTQGATGRSWEGEFTGNLSFSNGKNVGGPPND